MPWIKKVLSKAGTINMVKTTIFSTLLICNTSYALGLSTFRIYMDIENRQSNFLTFNKDQYTQHCNLFLRHYKIEADGNRVALSSNEEPALSANSWIRFAPKKFSLEPGKSQNIKFQMRRKANIEPNEYRSFLSVDCEYDRSEMISNLDRSIMIAPRLRHNVPIIVRTGQLDASIRLDNITINNNSLNVSLYRSGERSIHGDLQLIDTRNNQVLDTKPSISLYTEMPFIAVNLTTLGIEKEHLLLRFIEDKKIGGRIDITQKIK